MVSPINQLGGEQNGDTKGELSEPVAVCSVGVGPKPAEVGEPGISALDGPRSPRVWDFVASVGDFSSPRFLFLAMRTSSRPRSLLGSKPRDDAQRRTESLDQAAIFSGLGGPISLRRVARRALGRREDAGVWRGCPWVAGSDWGCR